MINWRTRIKETNDDQRRAESTTKTAAQRDSNLKPRAFITSHGIIMVRRAIVGDGFISRIEPLWNSTRVPVLPIVGQHGGGTDDRDQVHFFCRDRLSAEAMLHDDVMLESLDEYDPKMVLFHLGREDIHNDSSAKKIVQTLQRIKSRFDYYHIFNVRSPGPASLVLNRNHLRDSEE